MRITHPTWNIIIAIIVIVTVILIAIILAVKPGLIAKKIISPLPDASVQPAAFQIPLLPKKPSPTPVKDHTALISQIKQLTEKVSGIYSVYVVDLSTNQSFGFNESTIFDAASVNKLPILAALYFQAHSDLLDLDKRITIQQNDIQDYGTGVIRYQGAGVVYSLKSLAQLMMEKSDNTAAFVLGNVIGQTQIQSLISSWGLTQTDLLENKTSNKDMATLMKKMRDAEVTDRAHTEEMLGFLVNSDFENRIPRLLPKTLKVYHKIGNEVGNLHDVGFVADPQHPYYIGIMTNDVTDEPTTEDTMAQISKLVYDYMTQ